MSGCEGKGCMVDWIKFCPQCGLLGIETDFGIFCTNIFCPKNGCRIDINRDVDPSQFVPGG